MDNSTLNRLVSSFRESWPNLANAIEDHEFPPESNPTPLLTTIASTTDSPEKIMFCSLLKCFDDKFGILATQITHQSSSISEYESHRESMASHISELNERLTVAHQEISRTRETIENKNQLIETRLNDMNILNTRISKLNAQISSGNEQIHKLQTQINNSVANSKSIPNEQDYIFKPRRTTTDHDKFTGNQPNTEKRQMTYERWKTQIGQNLIIDKACFVGEFERISHITGQLTDKAWDAVQDGVKVMNNNPANPQRWIWKTLEELWETLDGRYILLDGTQTAKNKMDTLYQEKRAYGDFKIDFDHFAEKAKYDDRTKVDMLRKRLNSKITNVIDNQVNLPNDDDFIGWSQMISKIARNLGQQEHIAKIQQLSNNSPYKDPKPSQDVIDTGDPMDLSRIKLSEADRKYRKDNNLCMACGQKGHFAKDHHRKLDPIPMPKRSVNQLTPSRADVRLRPTLPNNPMSTQQRYPPHQNIQPLPMPYMYYNPMPYVPQGYSQGLQPSYSRTTAPVQLRALENTERITDVYHEDERATINIDHVEDDQLKGKPLS